MKPLLILALASMAFIAVKPKPKQGLPKYKHVIVVIEENHDFDALIGSGNSPYITALAENGALFTDSHGVTHPSQPNYLAIFAGSTHNVTDDKCLAGETPYATRTSAQRLSVKG